MKYTLWIVVVLTLLMVVTGNQKLWPLVLLAGVIANSLVMGVNGWKMPVRGGNKEKGVRHTPMTAETRLAWLGDVIPVGVGIASIGDFLLVAGLMGVLANRGTAPYVETVALLAFGVWAVGWAGGFNLKEKWDKEARRDSRKNIPILLMLILLGNLFGVHGCGRSEMAASVKSMVRASKVALEARDVSPSPAPVSHWRSLGDVALQPPPMQVLKRLKRENDEQERALAIAKARIATWDSMAVLYQVSAKRVRNGPACRITCIGCHGQWDKETLPEFCQANWISPQAEVVPGWDDVGNGYEMTTGRPGPATPGFKSYRLYWK